MKFLDDDSSLYEGASLQRYFRLRKWALIASTILISIGNSWFDIAGFSKKIFYSDLPDGIFHKVVWFSAIYILLQLIFLLLQVLSTYWRDLNDRVSKGLEQRITELFKEQRDLQIKDAEDGHSGRYKPFLEYTSGRINSLKHSDAPARMVILFTELCLDGIRIVPTILVLAYCIIKFHI